MVRPNKPLQSPSGVMLITALSCRPMQPIHSLSSGPLRVSRER